MKKSEIDIEYISIIFTPMLLSDFCHVVLILESVIITTKLCIGNLQPTVHKPTQLGLLFTFSWLYCRCKHESEYLYFSICGSVMDTVKNCPVFHNTCVLKKLIEAAFRSQTVIITNKDQRVLFNP